MTTKTLPTAEVVSEVKQCDEFPGMTSEHNQTAAQIYQNVVSIPENVVYNETKRLRETNAPHLDRSTAPETGVNATETGVKTLCFNTA